MTERVAELAPEGLFISIISNERAFPLVEDGRVAGHPLGQRAPMLPSSPNTRAGVLVAAATASRSGIPIAQFPQRRTDGPPALHYYFLDWDEALVDRVCGHEEPFQSQSTEKRGGAFLVERYLGNDCLTV